MEVHLTLSNGSPLNLPAKVQILDTRSIPIAEVFANRPNGIAEFRQSFADGTYRLRVSGPGIETTTVNFEIAMEQGTHREYVRVELASAESTRTSAPGTAATVSSQSMGVPAKARSQFDKGMAAYAKGDTATARQALELAIEIYPQYARAHNNLGVLLLNANEKTGAREEFTKAIEIDSRFAQGYVNRARAWFSEQRFAEAEGDLNRAIELEPMALNAIALLTSTEYALGNYDKVLAMDRRVHAIPEHEKFADVHLVAAEILLKRQHNEEALMEYQLFLKENPHDPRVARVQDLVTRLKAQRQQP